MRKLSFAILIIVLALTFGCDTNQGSFGDTLPGLYTLTTHVSPEEGGTVHPSGGEFSSGDGIEIEARPAEGYVFDRWEDDLTGNSNPDSLFFNANRTVTAHFVLRDYDLNIEIVGEGYVRETVVDQSSPVTVRLTAVAEDGWYFDRWEGDLSGSENPETVTMDEEKNVTAVFEQDDQEDSDDQEGADGYTITVSVEGEGSVERNPDKNYYSEGEEVTLTAIAGSGWIFIEWQGDLSGSENFQTVVMEEDIVVTALFEANEDTSTETGDPAMRIVQQPSETVAGSPVTPAPEVKLTDDREDPIEGAGINITLNKNSFASGSSTSAATNGDGIAVFDNLIIEKASSGYVLTFDTDEPGVSDISSTPFTVVAADVNPSNSSVTVSPTKLKAGEYSTVTVKLRDGNGNPIAGLSERDFDISVTGDASAGSVNETSTAGTYEFEVTNSTVGKVTVSVSANGIVLSDSPDITFEGGDPHEIVIVVQPKNSRSGRPINGPPTVRVIDEFGDEMPGINVNVREQGGKEFSNGDLVVATDESGIAEFDNLVIQTRVKWFVLVFSAPGVDDVVSERFRVSFRPEHDDDDDDDD